VGAERVTVVAAIDDQRVVEATGLLERAEHRGQSIVE